MNIITATVALTIGVTGYHAPQGKVTACGYQYGVDAVVAVPIEWERAGFVSCGDTIWIDDTPFIVGDTGCMLHHPVWDSNLWPMGIDLPRVFYPAAEWPTMSRRVVLPSRGRPLLTAWATRWCNGPLTVIRTADKTRFWIR